MLVTLAVYWPAIYKGSFIWDDNALLTENTAVKDNAGLYTIWFTTKLVDYVPLTSTSFWIEWRLWGMNAMGYHFTNVLLHALNGVLLWRVLQRLRIPGAWAAGLLFALHPVCVASAAWIAERKNTLSMVFYLLSILFFLRSEDEATAKKPNRKWYVFSLIAFLLALLSKGSVTVLPMVLLLVVWWRRNAITGKDAARIAPYFAFALAFGLTTILLQHRGEKMPTDPLMVRVLGGTWAVWFYLGKTIFPLGLTMVYPLWKIDPSAPTAYLPLLGAIVLLFVLWHFRFSWGRAALFALGYFVVVLGPVLGVFNMAYFAISRVSDHLQYLAVPAIAALIAAACVKLLDSRANAIAKAAPVAVIAAIFAAVTWHHAQVFTDPESLWRDNIAKNPRAWRVHNSYIAALIHNKKFREALNEYNADLLDDPNAGDIHYNIANAHYQLGDREQAAKEYLFAYKNGADAYNANNNAGVALTELGRYDEAIACFKQALVAKPGSADAYRNLGNALLKTDRVDEALVAFTRATELDPNLVAAHNGLGAVWDKKGNTDEAIRQFEIASKLDPNDASIRNNLALVMSKKGMATQTSGNVDEGIAQLLSAIQVNPTNASLHNSLGAAYDRKGNLDAALAQFDEATKLDPSNVTAQKNRGLVLSRKGRSAEAIAAFETALKLKPDDADLHNELGNALGRAGRVDEALPHFQKAVQADPTLAGAQNGLGAALQEKGRVDEAIPHFEEAIRLKPELSRAHFNLGVSYVKKNRRDDAIAQFKEALRLQPNYIDAQRYLEALTKQASR